MDAEIDFMKLTYTFGGIAGFLGVSLLFASAFIIAMLVRHKRQLHSAEIPRAVERTMSSQDDDQNDDSVVPEYFEIIDSASYQSVEFINHSLESSDSRNSNSETTNEQYNMNDDSSNNSLERNINAVVHQYVNTSIGNTYEQLKNRTTDIHTYDDVNASV